MLKERRRGRKQDDLFVSDFQRINDTRGTEGSIKEGRGGSSPTSAQEEGRGGKRGKSTSNDVWKRKKSRFVEERIRLSKRKRTTILCIFLKGGKREGRLPLFVGRNLVSDPCGEQDSEGKTILYSIVEEEGDIPSSMGQK